MAMYLELEKVLDDRNIITVQTKEYGSIEVIPVDTITDIELADVKPVKYSSWEYRTYPIFDRDGVARRCMRGYGCKACGHGEPEKKRFCGGCGAEMRGEDND